jgi:hypothetical protein
MLLSERKASISNARLFCIIFLPVPMGTCCNLHQQPQKIELCGISYEVKKFLKQYTEH